MKKRKTYQEEVAKLIRAIEIAVDSFEKYCPKDLDKTSHEHVISCYKGWKEELLHPLPQYMNLASLKYFIEDVFTYFQESSGETTEYFWKRINNEALGYERENKLKKILDRGRIKGRIEFDYVTDMMVVAEQVGLTTKEESIRLGNMLDKFEFKKKK
ncbi:hypothetical protein [Adhaeribacter radiodurans]|uniref:Uncharacterized protein n=1 Tax=Adhaeribacter radiodurans TaxID=2745197 RepID=A0A7L7LDW6_9BACT|nr:hypothetical protein [Adhaeribacter radiodurans]QMU30609.1 hypothetical protein HUW48_22425 [Adhaeribacter radiodurans]